jgi:hypothetical protein
VLCVLVLTHCAYLQGRWGVVVQRCSQPEALEQAQCGVEWSGQCHLTECCGTWKLEPESCDVVKKESVRGKVTGAFIGTVCTRQKLLFGKAATVCNDLGLYPSGSPSLSAQGRLHRY